MWLNRRSKSTHRGSIETSEDDPDAIRDNDHDLMRALSQIPPAKLAVVDESFVLLDSGLGAIFSAAMARRAAVERNKQKDVVGLDAERLQAGTQITPKKSKQPSPVKIRTALLMRKAAERFRAPVRRHEAQEATMNLLNDIVETHHIADSYRLDTRGMEPPKKYQSSDPDDGSSSEDIDPSAEIEHDEHLVQWAQENLKISVDRLQMLEESKPFRSKLRHQMLCWEALRADKLSPPGIPPMVPGAVEFLQEVSDAGVGSAGICMSKDASTSSLGTFERAGKNMFRDASLDSLTTRASPNSIAGQSVATSESSLLYHQKATQQHAHSEEVSPGFHMAAQSFFGLTKHKNATRMRRTKIPVATCDKGSDSPQDELDLFLAGPKVPDWPGRERLPVLVMREAGDDSPMSSMSESARRHAMVPGLPRLSMPPEQAKGPYSARARAYGSVLENAQTASSVAKKLMSTATTGASPQTQSKGAETEVVGGYKWSQRLGSHGQAADAAQPSFALRNPPAFVEPHREVMSTDVGKTPELAYFRRCEMHGLIPCQAVWSKFGKGIVDASRRTLSDDDVCAIVETAVDRAVAGYALLALDLSHNRMTDAGIEKVMRLLAEPRTKLPPAVSPPHPMTPPEVPGSALVTLSFAENGAIRFSNESVLDHLCKGLSVLRRLTSLDLSGIHARTGSIVSLCAAIERSQSVKALRLVDCGLGRTGQQEDCIAVAGLLGQRQGGWQGLVSADLALNFFNQSGFAAAAAALRGSRLISLSFAGNASMGLAGVASCGNKEVRFHPLQLLMEGLQFNTTLQGLDFANCCLGPDSAFVLEDALQGHPCLQALDMSENPLGDAGLRYLIRLLIANGTQIRIVGHREADATSHLVKFRFSQPGRIYRLNLRYPHERAIMRTLLRIGTGKARASALRHFKFDARQAKPAVEKDPDMDRWLIPTTGVFNFTFQPPMSQTAQRCIMVRSSELNQMSTMEAAAAAAAAASSMVQMPTKRTKNAEKRGTMAPRNHSLSQGTAKSCFHTGLGGDHHRTSLLQQNIADRDFAAIAGSRASTGKGVTRRKNRQKTDKDANARSSESAKRASRALLIDWYEVEELLSDSRIRISALRFPLVRNMFLSLVTTEQQFRFIHACSRDVSFNFTQVMQLCKDKPETADQVVCSLFPCVVGRTSQLLLLGAVKDATHISKEVSQCLWFQEGNLTGRYHLNLLKPADYAVAESCLLVNAWESEVGRILDCPDVSQRGNYEMLRNESWNEEPFTYSRDWCLPSHGFFKFDYSSIRRPPPKLAAMSEAGEVTRYLQKVTATAQIKIRALRAISVHIYLSTGQFRNLIQCFPMGTYRRDFFCMFHTRVVDLARFLGPELLYNHSVFSPKDCVCLLQRVGFLHLLNPLVPEGPHFTCNLAVYEERMVLDFFVQLSKEEPGGRVMGSSPGNPDGPVHSVPASWADKGVPCDQEDITCCYETTNPNMNWRLALAEKYCVGVFSSASLHSVHERSVSDVEGTPTSQGSPPVSPKTKAGTKSARRHSTNCSDTD